MFSLILAAILGYLLGSFPTAYLLVKWKSNIDIRDAGSGNVGSLNSFQVTHSAFVGLGVLSGDVLKGVAAVVLARLLFDADFWSGGTAGLGAVLGHSLPVWLRFRGGRGLATAAGTMMGIGLWFGLLYIAVWGAFWAIGFLIWRKVNLGNAFACVAAVVAILLLPENVVRQFVSDGITVQNFTAFSITLMALLLLKLIEPVKECLSERKEKTSTV